MRNRRISLACVALVAALAPAARAASSTTLLFPFVTNQAGFDTAVIITNASSTPAGGAGVSGTCTLTFYGASTIPVFTTPVVVAGQVYANLMSSIAPGFQGYVIAACAFPHGAGSTFVSDLGARNLAAGYEAQVLPTVEDFAENEARRELERALLLRQPLVSFYLPAAAGGQLEQIDQLVADTIARVTASGETTNNASTSLGYARQSVGFGKFKDAFVQYSVAYCRAVTTVARLSQCN